MPKVFISHSTKDREFVEGELAPLLNHHGIETWFSADDIKTAEHWETAIQSNLRSCDWFLVVLSPNAVSSQWVRAETGWALEERFGKVIPVLYRNVTPDSLNLQLRLIQFLDYRESSESARKRLLSVWGVKYDPTAQDRLIRNRRSPFSFKMVVTLTMSLLIAVVAVLLWFFLASPRAKQLPIDGSKGLPLIAQIPIDQQLTALNQALSRLHRIVGIYVDPATGAVVIIGTAELPSPQAPLLAEDAGFCLNWAATQERDPFGFGCALDHLNSDQKTLRVRYYGGVENTHVGLGLFQADLALKQYTLGKRADGTRIQSSIDAYPMMIQLLETPSPGSGILAATFWFKTDPLLQVSGDGRLAIVKTSGISVAYEPQEWQEGVFTRSSKFAENYETFSRTFSEHFEAFAREEPSFSWLTRMTCMTALAGWFAELGKSGSIGRAKPLAVTAYRTPKSIPMIFSRVERKGALGSGEGWSSVITLSGGVSLGTGLARITRGDDPMTRSIRAAIPRNLDRAQIGTTFELDTPSQNYLGIVLNFAIP